MSIERITPQQLHEWLQQENPPAVVDVRDEDRIGGHVTNSIHCPSSIFSSELPKLQEQLSGRDRVVFHCQLSQIRGPTCAKRYFINSTEPNQTVYVLQGGFSGWVDYSKGEVYTDKFVPDLYT